MHTVAAFLVLIAYHILACPVYLVPIYAFVTMGSNRLWQCANTRSTAPHPARCFALRCACIPSMSFEQSPQGRLKCMGRTVHTKGRFFTLYADKVAKRATRMDCRDVFDSVVFFGRACWLGKKEDNPEDEPLPLPESLHVRNGHFNMRSAMPTDTCCQRKLWLHYTNGYKLPIYYEC